MSPKTQARRIICSATRFLRKRNQMKDDDMNTAEICWLALLGGIVIVAVISIISMIPEMRRYARLRSM